jgi:hypothetical protein
MLNIPKSWSEVKVGTFQELHSVESETEIGVLIAKLSILADCDSEDIRRLPISQFNKIKSDIEFMSKPLSKKINLKIEIDGKKYGMIPDLNFLSAGEFLDSENWKEKSIENLHLYLALLYRPIIWEDGEDYKIEPHKSEGFTRRAELFRQHLTIENVWGTLLFFSSLGLNCTKVILDYLESTQTETDKPQKKMKKTSTRKVTKNNKQKNSTETGSGMI